MMIRFDYTFTLSRRAGGEVPPCPCGVHPMPRVAASCLAGRGGRHNRAAQGHEARRPGRDRTRSKYTARHYRPVSIGSRRSGPMRIDLRPEGARHLHQRTNSAWHKKTHDCTAFETCFGVDQEHAECRNPKLKISNQDTTLLRLPSGFCSGSWKISGLQAT